MRADGQLRSTVVSVASCLACLWGSGCGGPQPAPALELFAPPPPHCVPEPARRALDVFVRANRPRYAVAMTRARAFLDALEVDPIKLRASHLKGKKKELVASVLSEDQGGAKKLTKADLEDLFEDQVHAAAL